MCEPVILPRDLSHSAYVAKFEPRRPKEIAVAPPGGVNPWIATALARGRTARRGRGAPPDSGGVVRAKRKIRRCDYVSNINMLTRVSLCYTRSIQARTCSAMDPWTEQVRAWMLRV